MFLLNVLHEQNCIKRKGVQYDSIFVYFREVVWIYNVAVQVAIILGVDL
jgi:hypothetical protein